MIAVLATAVAIVASALVVGQAVAALGGARDWSWLSPGLGLAALVVAAIASVRLPGAGTTGAITLGVLVLVSLIAVRRSLHAEHLREAGIVGLATMALAALPFLAQGRVGILGVTDNGDLSSHLVLADALQHGRSAVGLDPSWSGYPTGPHSLVAAAATAFGVSLETAFNALLLAIPALASITAITALRDLSTGRRAVAAVLVGLPYLVAAYLVQSSFKEPLEALLVLTYALWLPAIRSRSTSTARAVVPLGLILGASVANFSAVGVAWPVAVTVCWWVGEAALSRRLPSLRPARSSIRAAAIFCAVLIVTSLPQLSRVEAFADIVKQTGQGTTKGGNVPFEIASWEVLGVWPSRNFRAYGQAFYTGMLVAVALAVAVYAAVWWIRRREIPVVAAAGGCLLMYLEARALSTPYYSAKALAIAAPATMLLIVRPAMTLLPAELRVSTFTRLGLQGSAVVLGVLVFVGAAAWSSALTLRGGRVAPGAHPSELARLRPLVRHKPTLYLGHDDYIPWLLRGSRISFPYVYIGRSQVRFHLRKQKRFHPDSPVDFDSVQPRYLDRFELAIAPRGSYTSTPPPNWHPIRLTRSYVLFKRRGPTPLRRAVLEHRRPGAILHCRTRSGRVALRRGVRAAVLPRPSLLEPKAWRRRRGRDRPAGPFGFTLIRAGGTTRARMRLPRGRWKLSLQYSSPTRLELRAGSVRWSLPPSLEGPGSFWRVGTLDADGRPVSFRVSTRGLPFLAASKEVLVGALAAVREGSRPRLVPMRRACGRYVDWYEPRTG